jgi:tripartite-type tricarboxylate transporter receptor subunit TctC
MDMRTARFLAIVVFTLSSLLYIVAPQAQPYPVGPVKILVALSPGSQTDMLARLLATRLGESWGKPVTVENRPGGAGAIAGSALVNSAPDGHTLMAYSDGHAINAALNAGKLPYDSLRDIARVAEMATMPAILVVSPATGLKSAQDLIALARSKPGEVLFASAGIGGGLHFSGELFSHAAGVKTVHVPYKGTPEALADVMSGRVHFMFSSPGPAMPLIHSKRVLALAVSTAQRSAALPDVPTLSETGLAGFEYPLWQGIFAPARTPKAIVDQLNRDISRVFSLPESQEYLAKQGLMHRPLTAQQFDDFVRADVEKLTKIIQVAGIKP